MAAKKPVKKVVKKVVKKKVVAKKAVAKKVVAKKAVAKKAPAKKVAPKRVVKKFVKKAPPKKVERPVSIPRNQQRSSGGVTRDFNKSRQYAGRGASFSLQEMLGFKWSKDATSKTYKSSRDKQFNIIKLVRVSAA